MIPKGFRAYGKPERVQEGDPSAWVTVRDVQTGKTTRTYTGATVSSVGLPQGFHYYGQGSSTPKANASDLPKGFRYYNANGNASKAHAVSKPSAPGCGSCAGDPSLGDLAREIGPTMKRLAAQAKKAESKGVDPWGKGYRPYKG